MFVIDDYVKSIDYLYHKDSGIAQTIIIDRYDREYCGFAECAEVDLDMKSEYTGCTIATNRAYLKLYQGWIKNEIKPQLRVLNQLYYSMNKSKKYDDDHYEARMLKRRIKDLEFTLTILQEDIKILRESLKNYIDEKEKLYQTIRKRQKEELGNID